MLGVRKGVGLEDKLGGWLGDRQVGKQGGQGRRRRGRGGREHRGSKNLSIVTKKLWLQIINSFGKRLEDRIAQTLVKMFERNAASLHTTIESSFHAVTSSLVSVLDGCLEDVLRLVVDGFTNYTKFV